MAETHIHPVAEQVRALRDMPLNGPLFMLKLLRFAPGGGAGALADSRLCCTQLPGLRALR